MTTPLPEPETIAAELRQMITRVRALQALLDPTTMATLAPETRAPVLAACREASASARSVLAQVDDARADAARLAALVSAVAAELRARLIAGEAQLDPHLAVKLHRMLDEVHRR